DPSSSGVPLPIEPQPPGVRPRGQTQLDLTIGPAFAYFLTSLRDQAPFTQAPTLNAFIDGNDCGRIYGAVFLAFFVVIPSRELVPGCGYEGAVIELQRDGSCVAEPIPPWHPGRLPFPPAIQPPGVFPLASRCIVI